MTGPSVNGSARALTSPNANRPKRPCGRRPRELDRSNKDLEQFAYVASHDLQEPLRMITGFLDLLVRRLGQGLDEKSQEYISFVTGGAQRMQALIRDLLEFLATEQGQATRMAVDLADPLRLALGSLRSQPRTERREGHPRPLAGGAGKPLPVGAGCSRTSSATPSSSRDPQRPCDVHVGVQKVIGHSSLGKGAPDERRSSSSPNDQCLMTTDAGSACSGPPEGGTPNVGSSRFSGSGS